MCLFFLSKRVGDMIDARQLQASILLVDDDDTIRRSLSLLLKDAGARVSLAENGHAACEKALLAWRSGEPFAVILMDIQMPVLDGLAATRRLRDAGYPGTIIAHSGNWAEDFRETCLQAGCDDYINKLLGWQEMIDVLSNHCERRRSPSTLVS